MARHRKKWQAALALVAGLGAWQSSSAEVKPATTPTESGALLGDNFRFSCRVPKADVKQVLNLDRDMDTVGMDTSGTHCREVKEAIEKDILERLKYNPKLLKRLQNLPGGIKIELLEVKDYRDAHIAAEFDFGGFFPNQFTPGKFTLRFAAPTTLDALRTANNYELVMHELTHLFDYLANIEPMDNRDTKYDALLPTMTGFSAIRYQNAREEAKELVKQTNFPKGITLQQMKAMIESCQASPLADFVAGRTGPEHYVLTNDHEFLARLAEKYFTIPDLLRKCHPALYEAIDEFYQYHMGRQLEAARKQENTPEQPEKPVIQSVQAGNLELFGITTGDRVSVYTIRRARRKQVLITGPFHPRSLKT